MKITIVLIVFFIIIIIIVYGVTGGEDMKYQNIAFSKKNNSFSSSYFVLFKAKIINKCKKLSHRSAQHHRSIHNLHTHTHTFTGLIYKKIFSICTKHGMRGHQKTANTRIGSR